MLASSLVLFALLPTIWIVDSANGPGTNFTDLPPAVAAAASGDTIIVRAGAYTGFSVNGKAVTIRGENTQTTVVAQAWTSIASVPAIGTFYLSGMTILGGLSTVGPGKFVLADLVVWNAAPGYAPGLSASSAAEVHASRCSFTGGPGWFGAIIYEHCRGAFDDCVFQGTTRITGSDAVFHRSFLYGSPGGPGLEVEANFLAFPVYGSKVRVSGTAANVIAAGAGTPMGYAWEVPVANSQYSSVVIHGPVTLVPSFPGGPLFYGTGVGSIQIGAPPLPYLSVTGTTTTDGGMLASQPITLTVDGAVPGVPFMLAVDMTPDFVIMGAPVSGPLLLPLPITAGFQGTLDGAGVFQMTATLSALQPLPVAIYAQVGVAVTAADVRLSNGCIRLFN
jgi:hypothetical protein